ncbi:hypothetical protein DNTS_024197 [Danionella cerebrum]|uniref:Uncharacterized protein n=1 Tax=Danionella cerebrum TaxID=2873325 RepID=A0A553RIN1_9TELE|nr:hypothetical protein DNTS_024197 [Danionella translucida]
MRTIPNAPGRRGEGTVDSARQALLRLRPGGGCIHVMIVILFRHWRLLGGYKNSFFSQPPPRLHLGTQLAPLLQASLPRLPALLLSGELEALEKKVPGVLVQLHIPLVEFSNPALGLRLHLYARCTGAVELSEWGDEGQAEGVLEEVLGLPLVLGETKEGHVSQVALGTFEQHGPALVLAHDREVVAAHQAEHNKETHHEPKRGRRTDKASPGSHATLLGLPGAHEGRHAVGELRPVRVQPAAPAGGEAREQPGVPLSRPVAGALLLARVALARSLELDVPDQVAAERGAPGFLDVQEHDHVLPPDVEIHRAAQVPGGEIKPRHEANQRAVLRAVGVRRPGSVRALPGCAATQPRG